ncbi:MULTISPECIES: cysteine dioxygenase family protein [unclassified Streptomyces]|uniref:cysteine dioxygenase family protein n=1 Tax=unclassified Streptomyces TaxID=2593676 RepID=UPI002DD93E41|nr:MULTISPECIES: cysteine dioxygenase family protein [unclassified Streptomyces]WSA94461.1 cysteine dioxygenase family protein [Streptomyces sp. NBC_01795]WSB78880.1 cysteine dioxygenase family protein [Streptomyces sp. NBC_01775]WSS12918.1 cysteine dioxygenase family protein [Streptomyces sp. NBC_01186]WSS41701.1 cysteine dioxygenase family protein [Streptomyces sp. NBC_01187]
MAATTETSPAPTAPTTGRLRTLVEDVREAVGRGLPPDVTAYLVGEKLAPHLGAEGLLTPAQREPDPECYRQHLLHAESDGSFSVVALVWLPGQGTSIHDHVSWCVTGVHQGEEHERRYRLLPAEAAGGSARLVATEDVVNPAGSVCGFAPPGDIHRVWNGCYDDTVAVSLHLYGADISRLGSSVRRVYDLPADA